MDCKERIEFRETLLKEIYDNYFETGGNGLEIIIGPDETEKRLALQHLLHKKLISGALIVSENQIIATVTITPSGISYVEFHSMNLYPI